MAVERVKDMTIEELKALVNQIIDQRGAGAGRPYRLDVTTLQTVLDSIEQHRIVPPKSAKSALQMLREDRDG